MFRILITALFAFMPLIAFAEKKAEAKPHVYQVGDFFEPYKLQTQHKKPHTMSSDTKVVILSFEMSLSKKVHQSLEKKKKDYLKKHHTEYIADISDMPDIITFLFAGPKMRGYDFPIIWARDDDFDLNYPQKKERLTVIELDDAGKIKNISFLKSIKEVASKIYGEGSSVSKKKSKSEEEAK
jgi:hypothetical protein